VGTRFGISAVMGFSMSLNALEFAVGVTAGSAMGIVLPGTGGLDVPGRRGIGGWDKRFAMSRTAQAIRRGHPSHLIVEDSRLSAPVLPAALSITPLPVALGSSVA
jgi:hypothetical protein